MYRVICPLVDLSCNRSGLEPYFEYAQPSKPNSSIKVDIALLSHDAPVWYIEAKKYARAIHPDMVVAYLHDEVMGAVSNGNYWWFVVRGQRLKVGPILDTSGNLQVSVTEEIIDLLACQSPEEALSVGRFSDSPAELLKNAGAAAVQRRSGGKGTRVYADKESFSRISDALDKAIGHCPPGSTTEY